MGPGHRYYRFIFTTQYHSQQETKLWDQGAQGKLQVWEWGRNGTVGEVFERLSAFESIDLGNPQLQEIFHSLIFFYTNQGKKKNQKMNEISRDWENFLKELERKQENIYNKLKFVILLLETRFQNQQHERQVRTH